MRYFLDTNIIIYALKGNYPAILTHFKHTSANAIVIPTVVMAEIEFGARKSTNYDRTISVYRKFTDVFEKIPFSEKAQQTYGVIRSELEKKGTPIGGNDMLIAATVMSEEGILVTHNVGEFSRIPGLQIEDWTKEQ